MSWRSKQGSDLLKSHDWLVQRNVSVLLTGARLIDPSQQLDAKGDVLIERGKITAIGEVDRKDLKDHVELDLRGKIVCPGLQDMHAHSGQPGREDRETLTNLICAAAAGGYTGVSITPDTDPVVDNAGIVTWLQDQTGGSPVQIDPVASVMRDDDGRRLSDIDDIYQAGVKVFSDTGRPIANAEILRRSFDYLRLHDLTLSSRAQDRHLAGKGVVREGTVSTRLGQTPWPGISETLGVVKNLLLAHHTGGKLHLESVSGAESLSLVHWARELGVKVTLDTTPHHLALTDEATTSFDGSYKVSPPLGSEADQAALLDALADGTIDAIASDHMPLTGEECLVEYSLVPDGVVGLETALGVLVKVMEQNGGVDWSKVVNLLSVRPRAILDKPAITLSKGATADLTLIDPEAIWEVDPKRFLSRGRNTPFKGWKLPAKAMGVLNRGWLIVAPDARMLVKS